MKTPRNSSAYKFCQHMWKHNQESQPGHSWLRINGSMHGTLMLAVTGGLHFMKGDFNRIALDFRSGYWIGNPHERFYSAAVEFSNMSACHSYEAWMERQPFIFEGQRMFVGREFQWKGLKARCSSINKDYFVAVVPKGWDKTYTDFDNTPGRIFKITREMIKAKKAIERAAAKASEAAKTLLVEAA